MKKKIMIFLTSLIILITLLISMFFITKVDAMTFSDFAHLGYSGVIGLSLSDMQSYGHFDEGSWQSCTQVLCIHSSNTANGTNMDPIMIIDINPDGSTPNGGTITTANGTVALSPNSTNAAMAYLCYIAESSDTHASTSYANNYQLLTSYWWLYGYSSYIQNHVPGVTFPTTGTFMGSVSSAQSNSIILAAQSYASNCTNSDVTYSARIVAFDGGWSQSRIVVFGKEAEIIKTEPTINKYISSATLPNGTAVNVGNRSTLTENQKYASPVEVLPGSTITYTIVIGGTGEDGFTVKDSYDTSALSYYSGNLNRWSYVGDSYTVKLTVDDDVSSSNTKYGNTAEIVDYGEESSDYIKIKYEKEEEVTKHDASGNYKKYIVKHNGTSVSDRSGYDNSTAKANPITVKNGDTVTYRLEVTNTSDYDINNLRVKDTLEEGLEYGGSSGNKYITIGDVDAGDTEYKDITVTVTKSDMYLLPIENKFVIYDGTYTDYEKVDVYYWFMGVRIYMYSYWVPVEKNISTSWFSSNANADYVQLDDPEIAGDVWIDKDKDGLKESGETLLSGIPVKLYQNGTLYATRTTDSSGHYSFGKIPKGNVPYSGGTRKYADSSGYNSYYVIFEYNGVKYENTVFTGTTGVTDTGTTNNWNSKSHAQDVDRAGFNNSLETIAYNKAYAGKNGTETSKVLEYTKSGHTSTLNWTAATTIQAKSIDLFVKVGSASGTNTIYADHIEYLKHINLGLVEKEQGDLSLKKDVISAVVTINGYTSTYNYAKLGTGSYTGEYKLATPYKLKVYKGDYDFRAGDYPTGFKSASDELDITLTYRVTLKNESSKYTSVVREVIDISTNSLTLQSTTMGTALTTSSYNSGTSYNYTGYQVHYIKMETSLAPNASTTFDLVYKVNKSNGAIILGEKANIAQIGAYSIYLNSKPAGVVDKDSNPGIINPSVIPTITDPAKYEDHCYYTSIIIEDTPGNNTGDKLRRKITGNVWEDLNTTTVSQTGQKLGDGKKNSNEKGAQNVTVVLLEAVKYNGTEYLIETGLSTETDSSGNYTLMSSSGSDRIHAGEYVVRFIYGDEASEFVTATGDTIRYSGQDYKSTIYAAPGTATNDAEVLDATAFATLRTSKGAQVSVARDDEIRRLEVVDYSTQMTYKLDSILKAHNDNTIKEELAKNTSMFADTKVFNVQIEKTNNTGVNVLTTVSENVDGTKTYTYTIGEVNFGLIERPITKLELMDDIKEITAVTASGEEILHIYFDISYKYNSTTKKVERTIKLNEVLSTGDENVQMLDRTSSTKGFRYVNIDSELLQGMKITIKYQFAIANIGDIDTSNQNLIDMVKNYNVDEIVNTLNTSTVGARYKLKNVNSGINSDLLKNTTFTNVKAAVNQVKSSYGQYKTVVGTSANNKDYNLGYFLGDTYYGTYNSSTDKIVETRVDQVVSYVDNDLLFSPEDNVTSTGSPKFQTYTGAEIEAYALLKGVTAANVSQVLVDSDNVSYITDTRNNLAFNIEDGSINGELYKYLTPLRNETTVSADKLYMIELNASRVLASELDVENVVLDNLTEIVKISNTVGRKAYIEFIDTQTGNVITPGPSGPTGYLGNTPDFIKNPDDKTVGQKEIDTNFTETVTFSPPTGLSQTEQKARTISTTLLVVLVGIVILAAGGGVAYMIGRKKIYK